MVFFFNNAIFLVAFQNSFIIQELFFQLIGLRRGNQFFFEAYFRAKRAEKRLLMKTPMDKAIINKNKNETC
jgi:hypothetical protein